MQLKKKKTKNITHRWKYNDFMLSAALIYAYDNLIDNDDPHFSKVKQSLLDVDT